MRYDVIEGDSRLVLGHFPDGFFHGIITDPPHGLGFMGLSWDEDLPAQSIWDECLRVLKPGGHIWVISSDRMSTTVGFYIGLERAGFRIEQQQTLHWLNLQGMPKSTDISKDADERAFRGWLTSVGRARVKCEHHVEEDEDGNPQRCVECERIFTEGGLSHVDWGRTQSAAVNGEYAVFAHATGTQSTGHTYTKSSLGIAVDRSQGAALIKRLVFRHWPSSSSDQRAQWEAIIGEPPDGWDTSRPPGVRAKTGYYRLPPDSDSGLAGKEATPEYAIGTVDPAFGRGHDGHRNVTAPSTPLAAEWDGWRGSSAPLTPMVFDILHAQKPWRGTYLAAAARGETAGLNIGGNLLPFGGDGPEGHWPGARSGRGDVAAPGWGATEGGQRSEDGRVPGNLITYGELLGKLSHQASLDKWAKRCGLPAASVELLESGLVYALKPSRAEKDAGLSGEQRVSDSYARHRSRRMEDDGSRMDGKPPARGKNQHPTCKPVSLCAFLIALCTREGDLVLDPFSGSGTTGVGAKRLGRAYVGIELDEEGEGYCDIARARIAAAKMVDLEDKQLRMAFEESDDDA